MVGVVDLKVNICFRFLEQGLSFGAVGIVGGIKHYAMAENGKGGPQSFCCSFEPPSPFHPGSGAERNKGYMQCAILGFPGFLPPSLSSLPCDSLRKGNC